MQRLHSPQNTLSKKTINVKVRDVRVTTSKVNHPEEQTHYEAALQHELNYI